MKLFRNDLTLTLIRPQEFAFIFFYNLEKIVFKTEIY